MRGMEQGEVTYRWLDAIIDGVEHPDWDRVEDILRRNGWMSLNRHTSRVLLAERNGSILSLFIFQLIPFLGPVWSDKSVRGTGLADEMTQKMYQFLLESNARGWIALAESEHGRKMCEDFGMQRIEYTAYIKIGEEGRVRQ